MTKSKKKDELEQNIAELTLDLQRTRADFENYRKRVEDEKTAARASGRRGAILQLLNIIDDIDRALQHIPEELKENAWANGVAGLEKKLQKTLGDFGVTKIDASAGVHFNPDVHEAIQLDEDADGEHEVISEEMRAGYLLDGQVVRPSMVKVTKR